MLNTNFTRISSLQIIHLFTVHENIQYRDNFDIITSILNFLYIQNIVHEIWFRVMVFNATFNNITDISWQSVLLMKETGVPRKNHQPVANQWQILSHNVVSYEICITYQRIHVITYIILNNILHQSLYLCFFLSTIVYRRVCIL